MSTDLIILTCGISKVTSRGSLVAKGDTRKTKMGERVGLEPPLDDHRLEANQDQQHEGDGADKLASSVPRGSMGQRGLKSGWLIPFIRVQDFGPADFVEVEIVPQLA